MIEAILVTLILLQIKHYYVDFVNQSDDEIRCKGIYGDSIGLGHSVKHGVGTALCLLAVVGFDYMGFCIVCGMIDFVVHYHIDYIKANYGKRDITSPKFWNHLGLDQMCHQITYLVIVYLMV